MHHTGKNKKYCPKCKTVKEEEYFATDTAQNDQHDRCGWCRDCVAKRSANRRAEQSFNGLCIEGRCKNKAEVGKIRCSVHLMQNRMAALVAKGLSPTEVEKVKTALCFFNLDGRVCSVCHIEVPVGKEHVDHDHHTGKFRSILCQNCNRLLGIAKESIIVLEYAIQYLRRFQ